MSTESKSESGYGEFLLYDPADPESVKRALRDAFERGRKRGKTEKISLESFRVPRLPWPAFFMLHAHLAATRSTCDRGPELLLDPGRRGVGAVLVRETRVIAGGYNGSPPGEPHCSDLVCDDCEADWSAGIPEAADAHGFARAKLEAGECPDCGGRLSGGHVLVDGHCVRTLHAEENALLQCALDGVSPAGATVYTTAGPCYDCAKRLLRVRVARVVFGGAYESRYGLSREARRLLIRNGVEVERLDVRDYLGKDGR